MQIKYFVDTTHLKNTCILFIYLAMSFVFYLFFYKIMASSQQHSGAQQLSQKKIQLSFWGSAYWSDSVLNAQHSLVI